MNKKRFSVFVSALFLVVLGVESARACSISINQLRMKNDLTAEGLSELGITIDKVTSATTSAYSHSVVSEDPQTLCPTQMRYEMRLQVTFRPNIVSTCSAEIQIVKNEHWVENPPGGVPETYTVTGLETKVCRPVIVGPIIPRPIRP